MTRNERQRAVGDWCHRAFGTVHATHMPQRGVRLLEEAIELAQATGVTEQMAHALVDFVFGRPVGEVSQEAGGVGVTLLALCQAAGISADQAERDEVRRVLSKPVEHWQKRNAAKDAAGFSTIAPREVA